VTHAVRPDGEILLLFLAVSMPVRFDSLGMGTRFDTHTHARSSSTHARGAHPASAATVLHARRFGSVERSGGRLSRAAVQPDGRSGGGSEGEGQGTVWVSAPAGRNAPRADSRPPVVTHAVRPDGEILLLFLAVSMPVRFDSLGMGTLDTHVRTRDARPDRQPTHAW
jgi:hypothetical protein